MTTKSNIPALASRNMYDMLEVEEIHAETEAYAEDDDKSIVTTESSIPAIASWNIYDELEVEETEDSVE